MPIDLTHLAANPPTKMGSFACYGKDYIRQLQADADSTSTFEEYITKRVEGGHAVPFLATEATHAN